MFFDFKKPTVHRFIVVSHPRCATSYYRQVLSKHKDIFCYDELFNNSPITKKFLKSISVKPYLGKRDKRTFRVFLDQFYGRTQNKIKKKVIGFQLFHGQLDDQSVDELISDLEYSILLQRRENILQAAVSYEIARNTGQWSITQKTNFETFEIDENNIIDFITKYGGSIKYYRKLMKEHNKPFLEIEYNSLFSLETLNRIFTHLNVETFDSIQFEDWKLNSADRYRRISNIDQIEEKFGNPENGFLFK